MLTANLLCWNMVPFFYLLPRDVGLNRLTAAAAVSLILASIVTACRLQTHEAFKIHAGRFMSKHGQSWE